MKKLFYLFICTIVASASFTSCLSDDDDDDKNTLSPLTAQQRAEQLAAIQGFYSGQLFFINDTTLLADSVDVDWKVTAPDSTLTVSQVPVKVFSQGIGNSIHRKLLNNSDAMLVLNSNLIPYVNDSEQTGYYTFWSIPTEGKKTFSIVDEEGKGHEVTIEFMQQVTQASGYGYYTYYAIGQFYDKKFLSYILIKGITVDGSTNSVNRVMYILGNKVF
jgi:hypothetical protein